MNLNATMGLISTVALFLPVFLILALRLGSSKTFPALLVYYFIVFVYNLFTEGYLPADPRLVQYWGLSNNLLDAPLMMTFLIYFSTSPSFTKKMRYLIAAFILFEIIVLALRGLNVEAITIILGPGILLVIMFCILFFIRHTKITILHRKSTGKALIAAALLFAYGCYGIIYLLYYVIKTQYVADTFLIYFLVSTISSLLLCTGIFVEQKRIRKLNELRITRRELSDIYADEKKAIPLRRTALLDFDRDQWN